MTARDPGLQPERTRLAWRRTVLTITAVALLMIRLAVVKVGGPLGWTVAAITMLGWQGVLWAAQHRIWAMAAAQPATIGRLLRVPALTAVGYVVLGGVLVIAYAAR